MLYLKYLDIEAIHVDELPGGDETSDHEIIKFADRQNFIVLTKDFDFSHSCLNCNIMHRVTMQVPILTSPQYFLL